MAQQNVIEKPDLHALPTISNRMTFIYLEHCKVSRENGAVTATDLDGTVYIPAAAITVLLLGPGTLFPAYAGVILMIRSLRQSVKPFPRIRGGDPGSIDDFIGELDFSPHTQGYTIPKKSGAFKAPLFSKYTAKTYFIPFTLYPASVTALESTSSATSLSSVM